MPSQGREDSVCAIAYSEDYQQWMDMLRLLLSTEEFSERGLDLTDKILEVATAHYTTWHYRRCCLKALKKDPWEEIKVIDHKAHDNPKNYQIWYHRRAIVEMLGDSSKEISFVDMVLEEDGKNYHAWAHRQWCCLNFGMWEGELENVTALLEMDIRNNSAWNHRWFVIHNCGTRITPELVAQEVEYAWRCIERTPNNESPWNYLRGFFLNTSFSEHPQVKENCVAFVDTPVGARCVHLHKLLATIYEQEDQPSSAEKAAQHFEQLRILDSIRAKYWERRRLAIFSSLDPAKKI